MDRYIKAAFTTTLVLFLASCGGGGSDSGTSDGGSSTSSTEYPINNAISAFEQTNHNYTLHANSGGNSYTLELAWAAGSQQSFGGVTAFTTTRTLTLFQGATLLTNDVVERFYLLGPYEPIGALDSNGQVYVDSNQFALPAQTTIGTSGAFDNVTVYSDSTLTFVIGHETDTWALNAGPGSDASLCANAAGTISGNAVTESDCYTVDSSGNVLGLQITLTINGVTTIFQ